MSLTCSSTDIIANMLALFQLNEDVFKHLTGGMVRYQVEEDRQGRKVVGRFDQRELYKGLAQELPALVQDVLDQLRRLVRMHTAGLFL